MSLNTNSYWNHTADGQLRLQIADRTVAGLYHGVDVPTEVTDLVNHEQTLVGGYAHTDIGPPYFLTADPPIDLIRLESRLRRKAADHEYKARELRQFANTLRADLAALTRGSGTGGLGKLRHRRRVAEDLRDTLDYLAGVDAAHEQARDRIRTVREFVIALDISDGRIARARAGWLRNPTPPAFVSIFASERVFVIANPRRAIQLGGSTAQTASPGAGGGFGKDGTVVASERFGVGWRRDGDDDNPTGDETILAGPWELGYVPNTGEVYASRRCHYLDEQVWLLGRHRPSERAATESGAVSDPDVVRRLLTDLQNQHMLEPNSLIYAAHAVHDALHEVEQGVGPDGQRDRHLSNQLNASPDTAQTAASWAGHKAGHDTGPEPSHDSHSHRRHETQGLA